MVKLICGFPAWRLLFIYWDSLSRRPIKARFAGSTALRGFLWALARRGMMGSGLRKEFGGVCIGASLFVASGQDGIDLGLLTTS
jgi:hypothetical protein